MSAPRSLIVYSSTMAVSGLQRALLALLTLTIVPMLSRSRPCRYYHVSHSVSQFIYRLRIFANTHTHFAPAVSARVCYRSTSQRQSTGQKTSFADYCFKLFSLLTVCQRVDSTYLRCDVTVPATPLACCEVPARSCVYDNLKALI